MSTREQLPDFPEDDARRSGASPMLWALLVAKAAWRRKGLAAAVFVLAMVACGTYFFLKTPVYRVEAKILAQRPQALPSAVRSAFEDVPTRSAADIVHQRENLMHVAEQAGLLSPDEDGREAPKEKRRRLPDWMARALGVHGQKDDPAKLIVAILDKRLLVTGEEGTIAIQIDWPDPQQAYALVNGALQNFLEARHVMEVKAMDEVLFALESRAAALREQYENVGADVQKRASVPRRPTAPRVHQPSPDLVRLQAQLEARRRALGDVEEFRRRRLADLQAQLDQARTKFSDAHPAVIGFRKDIEALNRESPQVQSLREEERKAREEYEARLASEGYAGPVAAPSAAALDAPSQQEDPELRDARSQLQAIVARINVAQVERDAARAAFKYRYNVIWPPQVPTDPVSPDPRKVFGLGALAALLAALLSAAAPDVLRGRIVERWQVEDELGVQVLGEVRRN